VDKYIDLVSFYLLDWQQAAIDNTRYSVVLFIMAFFLGSLIVTFLKRGAIANLKQQLVSREDTQKKTEEKCQNLIDQQTQSQKEVTEFKEKINHLSEQKEKSESLYSELEKKYKQQSIEIESKQSQIDTAQSMLDEKEKLIISLESDLEVQKEQFEAYTLNDKKIEEMEVEISTLVNKNNLAKQQVQQLSKELAEKSAQLEKGAQRYDGKATEMSDESLQQKITEFELTIQQQYQQIIELSEKLQQALNSSTPASTTKNKVTKKKDNMVEKSDWFQETIKGLFHKMKSKE